MGNELLRANASTSEYRQFDAMFSSEGKRCGRHTRRFVPLLTAASYAVCKSASYSPCRVEGKCAGNCSCSATTGGDWYHGAGTLP